MTYPWKKQFFKIAKSYIKKLAESSPKDTYTYNKHLEGCIQFMWEFKIDYEKNECESLKRLNFNLSKEILRLIKLLREK